MDRADRAEYLFGSILLLSNKFQIWGDNLIPELTLKQWFLLILISKMDAQAPTVKEVADFSGTSRQNVKKLLEHLESEGFVRLSRSKTDARAWSVALTPRTFAYFSENAKMGANAVSGLFEKISDSELDSAISVADRLLSALEETKNEKFKN